MLFTNTPSERKKELIVALKAGRKKAEETARKIIELKEKLYSEQKLLQEEIDLYYQQHLTLVETEFLSRGLNWCTKCHSVSGAGAFTFILLQGRETYSGGYQNSCYGFRDFSHFHRACLRCREEAFDRHGYQGPYDTFAKDRANFYVFCVERRKDGYWARKFGEWVKVKEDDCKLPQMPFELFKKIVKEWTLLPHIKVEPGRCCSEKKLVIQDLTKEKPIEIFM